MPFAETAQTSVFLILRTSDGACIFSVPRPGSVGCSRLAVVHGHGAQNMLLGPMPPTGLTALVTHAPSLALGNGRLKREIAI